MFEGFELDFFDVGPATLRVRYGGSGPPILLLHGHPRTHATWHRVAASLSTSFTVVCPDLRGYGQSSKPAPCPDHAQASKRALAHDCASLRTALGHPHFNVAGHDRGALVAFRLALDWSERVRRLAVLDALPIVEHLDRCDVRFASAWWHWFFYLQKAKPEQAILADPDAWYGNTAQKRAVMGDEAWADYLLAVHDPRTVTAMLEDYRAGFAVDRHHEMADRAAGRRVSCPTLCLWSSQDDLAELHGDPRPIWQKWVTPALMGAAIDCGHHMAEEAPLELASRLAAFFN